VHLESHLVSKIKAKDPQFCSRHTISFGDVGNMLKIDKVLKVEKFGVQAYVVNLIQICTALASDHPRIGKPIFGKLHF
jgi:hypothetical protein